MGPKIEGNMALKVNRSRNRQEKKKKGPIWERNKGSLTLKKIDVSQLFFPDHWKK